MKRYGEEVDLDAIGYQALVETAESLESAVFATVRHLRVLQESYREELDAIAKRNRVDASFEDWPPIDRDRYNAIYERLNKLRELDSNLCTSGQGQRGRI